MSSVLTKRPPPMGRITVMRRMRLPVLSNRIESQRAAHSFEGWPTAGS